MALELPGWVVIAFNYAGLPWPGIDEDELRAWATSVRTFAGDITGNSARTNQVVAGLAGSSQSSFTSTLATRWEQHNQLIADLHEPLNIFADALDAAADVVVAQKYVVIGAAIAFATEFAATQVGAIFTLGADEAALPEEIISTRAIIDFAIEVLKGALIGELINVAVQEISDHVSSFVGNLLTGGLQVVTEYQSLKISYGALHDAAQSIRGQASETEATGETAYAENANRDIEDPGEAEATADGWQEVVQAVKQALLDLATSLFKSLPQVILRAQEDAASDIDNAATALENADAAAGRAAPHDSGQGPAPESDLVGPASGPSTDEPEPSDLKPVGSGGGSAGRGDSSVGGAGDQGLGHGAGVSGGQASEGNGATPTGGDPVDIVSGQMLTTAVDLELPGVLPLVLRRAYASGYQAGRLFGPGWSSTLDQRIEIDEHGVRFAGDDAQILRYPLPAHDAQFVLPVAGARWPLSWDRATDTIRVEDPERGRTWHFDAAGADRRPDSRETRDLTRITDRNGNTIEIRRDADGLPAEVIHSGGYRVAVDCSRTDDGPRIVGLRLPDAGDQRGAGILRYDYDILGRLVELTDFSGVPYRYEYDDANRITAWVDRAGYRYQYDYDESGRVVRGTGDGGFMSASFDYDTDQRVTVITNSLGHAIAHHYDEHGHLTRVIAPDGGTITAEFDRYGRILSHTDELGRTTRFELNDNGDPVRSVDAAGNVMEIGYSDLRMVTSVAYAGMTRAAFTYDRRGNLLTETDAAGAVTRYEYDDRGGMISATDALGNRSVIERDPAGLITSVTDALGRTSRVQRNRLGHVVEFTDAQGASTLLARRPDGLITEKILADGSRQHWDYDAAGRATELRDEAGERTLFDHGPFGMMTARTQPDGARFEFTYDTEFHLTGVTSGQASWTYEYDAAGRLAGEQDFNGRRRRYVRDAAGQLLELTGADDRSTAFTYSDTGDVIARRSAGGAVTTFDYDAAGFLRAAASPQCTVEYTRDNVGRTLTETVNGRTLAYEYDLLGRCTRRVTPGGIVSQWTYDATDHPLTLAATAGSLAFEYDELGRETTRYLGDGIALTQAWDVCHRLTRQSLSASAVSGRAPASTADRREIGQRAYSYAVNGLANDVADSVDGRRAITLTPAGRIAEVSGENWTERYAYDSLGNITRADAALGDGSPLAEDRVYAGTLLQRAGGRSYEYDERGRLARMLARTLSGQRREWRYTWDDDDQLIEVVTPDRGTWAYRYDPFGRRIAKQRLDEPVGQAGGGTEYVEFTWDETRVAEQVSVRADGTRHSFTWDWDPGTWRLATQTERTWSAGDDQAEVNRQFFAIVADLANEPYQFVAADGEIVRVPAADIWGRPATAGARPGPLGKPGQYRDEETGLDYNYFRYYDPRTGRYLTGDPLGLEPAPNQYAYVSNPLAWIDPLGLTPGPQAGQDGGRWGWLQPANPPGTPMNTYEINHIPAQDSWKKLGLTDSLSPYSGPAIRMEYDDHRKFISTGASRASKRWRAAQADLIKQGKFDEAMQKDIAEIRRVHGTKYNAAIEEMVKDMPKNAPFQEFLRKNSWTIRYCLLQ